MKNKTLLLLFVIIFNLMLSPHAGMAAAVDIEESVVIQAQDSAVISQLNPNEMWTPSEELLVDVNHKDAAFIKFNLPAEIDENKVIKLRLHSTASFQSDWKVYGIKNLLWSSSTITWNKAGNSLLKDDYRLFSDNAEYIASFPLIGEEQIFGEVDVTDYIMSQRVKSDVTFGLSTQISKSRIASHLYSDESFRPCLVITEKMNGQYEENLDRNNYARALKFVNALGYLPMEGGLYYPQREVTAKEANHAFELMMYETSDVFKKNDDVTVGNVIRELVIASGYDVLVRVSDKYTYPTAAAYAGITKKVEITDYNMHITRDVFAQLLFNTLSIDLMEQTAFGDREQYGENSDKTLLSETRRIYKTNGIVDGNEYTTLTSTAGTGKNTISIDGKRYNIKDTGDRDLLGYRVNAWYYKNEDTDSEDLVYLEQDMDSEAILDIRYDHIIDYSAYTYKFEKNEGNKAYEATLEKGFDLIYNGVCKSNFESDDLKPSYGVVRLLDNNKDGLFDVVKVTQYENYVVALADATKYEIIDYYEPQRRQTLDETLAKTSIEGTEGQKILFSEIRNWNVISIAKNSDAEMVKAVVNTESVSGAVTEITESEVFIDNTLYHIASSFLPYCKPVFQLGDYVNVYFDAMGNIAGCRVASSSNMQYGYLVDAQPNRGLAVNLQLKIFTVESKMAYFNTDDKLIIDGEKRTGIQEQLNGLGNISQLIMYRTNDNGNIVEIDTKNSGGKEGKNQLTEIIPVTNGLVYRSRARSLSSQIVLNSDCIIFALPNNVKSADDNEFEVKSIAYLANDQTLNGVSAYTLNDDMLSASVITMNNTSANGYAYVMLIDSISYVVNANEETACKLYGLINGKFDSVVVSGEYYNEAKGYKEGDFIRFSKNIYGDVVTMQQVYDESSSTFLLSQPTSLRMENRIAYERVYNRKGNIIQTTMDFSNDLPNTYETYDASLFTIYVYDYRNKNRVYIGEAGMLTDYKNMRDTEQKVLLYTSYGDPIAMIVYR